MAAGPGKGIPHPLNYWRVRLLTRTARYAIAWERLWPKLLPSLAVLALFFATALFDVLPMLPFWLHITALVIFAAVFGYCLKGLSVAALHTDTADGRRRLERDSGLAHRPLTALQDQPVNGAVTGTDEAGQMLWRAHIQRMAGLVHHLRVRLPSPGMARFDPYGLRAAVLLVMIIAGATGGADAGARLERALVPKPHALTEARLSLDVWITPPAYTGMAPLFLERPKAEAQLAAAKKVSADKADTSPPAPKPIVVPVGSTFLAQMSASGQPAEIKIGARAVQFKAIDPADPSSSARAEGTFKTGDTKADAVSVTVDGRAAAAWAINVVADQVPEVEFTAPPKNMGRGLLGVAFEATDDYGLQAVGLTMHHPKGWPVRGTGGEKAVSLNLPAPGLGTRQAKGQSTQDMSAHPWAGTVVELRLSARDAAKQTGESDAVSLALPERIFNHPVARAIIAARKKLNRPDEAAVTETVAALENIAVRPHHFFHDTVVFLTLAVARSRLAHDGGEAAVASVQKLLWETALRIEDGEFSIADRDLRDAQKNLMEALKNRSGDKELDRLMDQLQRAMDKYMSALAEHLARQGLTDLPQNPSTQMMEGGDLQRMLDQIRELSRTGAKEAAKRLLSELNRMLNSIRNGARMARPPQGLEKGRQLLKGLRGLAKRQQQLLDRNFRQSQRPRSQENQRGNQRGNQPGQRQGDGQQRKGGGADGMARDQEQLRRDLGRFMLQMDDILGAIPPTMGKADRAMKGAGKSLGRGDQQGAVPQQTEALKQLRQATEGLAEQMARRMQGTMGLSMGRQGRQPQRGRDPFGRAPGQGPNGGVSRGGVKVPNRMEMRRSREILDELRRRSGDRNRSAPERDYIERLIDQF